MDGERDLAPSHRLLRLAEKFRDKRYRDGYVASHTRGVLAQQMRNFRGTRSQAEYATKIKKQKTVVARLENPAYTGWSLRTMLEIAREEDVAVIVRFVDFPTFVGFTNDLSDDALSPRSYDPATTNQFMEFALEHAAPTRTNSMFFGQSANLALTGGAVVVSPINANTLIASQGEVSYYSSPFEQSLQNANMLEAWFQEIVRQKNNEIYSLRNQVVQLQTQLADAAADRPIYTRYIMEPQNQTQKAA